MAVALEAGVDAATLRAALTRLDEKERTLHALRARLAAQAEQRAIERGDDGSKPHYSGGYCRSHYWSVRRRLQPQGGPPSGGEPCPTCRAMRRVPSLRVEGVVLDALVVDELGPPATGPGIPFRLVLGAG